MASEERGKYTSLNWGVDCTTCVKRGQCSVRGGVAQKCDHGAWNESLGMVLEQARQVDPLFANRVSAACKREMAAKDAEIAKLNDCRNGECERIMTGDELCAGCLLQFKAKDNMNLRSLVKELADALLSFLAILRNPCSIKKCREECSVKCREISALVAKAREVCDA